MSDRIDRKFETLRRESRAGLVTFVTAGDPDPETSLELVSALPQAGADLIELGMPFTDPMADGPAIQLAGQRALAAGQTLARTLDLTRAFRERDQDTPLILMGYFNPLYIYGVESFVRDASAAGVDGLIIVDLPAEEDDELRPMATAAGLDLIRLVTPTTSDDRLSRLLVDSGGFVYYVSVTGVTGTRTPGESDVVQAVERIRATTALPVAVGFGIRSPANAEAVARHADAAVVGTAIVQRIADRLDDDGRATPSLVGDVTSFVGELASAVRGARLGAHKEKAEQ